jgi:hypothetical protein
MYFYSYEYAFYLMEYENIFSITKYNQKSNVRSASPIPLPIPERRVVLYRPSRYNYIRLTTQII